MPGRNWLPFTLKSRSDRALGAFGPEEISRGRSTLNDLKPEWKRQAGSAPPEGLPSLDDLTRHGEIMGSPHYMAPEQAWGENSRIGPQTDLYSVGAILYHMLTGSRPFEGATMMDLLERVKTQRPAPIQPKVSRELEAIVWQCMEKRIEHRYQSAVHLTDDLQRFLDGYAILGPGPENREPAATVGWEPSPPEQHPHSTTTPPARTSKDTRQTRSWWHFWR